MLPDLELDHGVPTSINCRIHLARARGSKLQDSTENEVQEILTLMAVGPEMPAKSVRGYRVRRYPPPHRLRTGQRLILDLQILLFANGPKNHAEHRRTDDPFRRLGDIETGGGSDERLM